MKCKGKTKGQNCEPGLGQCKKGFLCRKEIIEKNEQQLVFCLSKIY